ncbi:MAG: Stk1 family PASTA domain-containing Ser/Thr kinase [Oscillospiraceae bacterium]|nr:Stk1 family PASTA domain-containing Ser/Thr kinase [Oscillospiraceae bacterium]
MDNDKYIGRLLDNRYEIQEVIGVGGMAVVYKARCHRLNRLVAIKILKDEYSKDEEFRRRFHAEGQAVAMLSHPNIVSVYDVSTSDEADYIVMELIDGISLKQYMEKKGVLNWKETLHFAIQICKALEHAHSRGIVHRDIKPHNVMVLKNGSVKVADFGIARVMSKSNTLTKEALGSVHYISPEQARGGRVDNRSDIYSLGVVMYEMITGRPPYDGESPVGVAIQHINGGAKLPSVLNPNIPGGLEQIIMRAMAHEPTARYTTATAMLSDLDEFRKLPTILFDYNTPPTDEVTRFKRITETMSQTPKTEVVPTPPVPQRPISAATAPRRREQTPTRSTAQRKAASKTGQQARRKTSSRRYWEEYDEEEGNSKVVTIAVVACSAVAVIAIIIFLVALLNGGLGGGQQMVMIPTLVGKNYDTLPNYSDIVIDVPVYAYNDTYEKGQISYQNPAPGEKVQKGTKVHIKVSLGPEPTEKTMENLINQKQSVAENYLKGQEIQYLCRDESSSTVAEGLVCRTEPAAGEKLKEGQTVILYISTGLDDVEMPMPVVTNQSVENAKLILARQEMDLEVVVEEEANEDIEVGVVIRTEPAAGEDIKKGQTVKLFVSTGPAKKPMINVVGEDITVALKLLNVAGFKNVRYDVYVNDPSVPEGQVVEQSFEAGEEVPVSAEIVLTLAKGGQAGSMPQMKTKKVVFKLHSDTVMTDAYELEIRCNGEILHTFSMKAFENSVSVDVTGYGIQVYELRVNGEWERDVEVNFDE